VIVLSKARLQIIGKVQGVFYRQSAQEMANSLNLKGWVKNLSDGSVLIEVEGAPESIKSFISWCKRGPSRARVDSVEVEWLAENHKSETNQSEQSPAFRIIG
jgi:acylphosphatase